MIPGTSFQISVLLYSRVMQSLCLTFCVCFLLYNRIIHIVLYNKVAQGDCAPHDQISPDEATDCSLEAGVDHPSDLCDLT